MLYREGEEFPFPLHPESRSGDHLDRERRYPQSDRRPPDRFGSQVESPQSDGDASSSDEDAR